MPSLIPGYNYDIFISYRQKDNKGDRWVSEFVDALKTELESTFKEDISVYFDINPHDGLLETHDVDESLKEKLQCLIFIPIISRTYCDPKSFAWEHEFKAFVEQASKDQYGLKVKLPNGNVASRVLPVRIHDLDPSDVKECESVLGGVLRGIEFIYKEAGIDKPLTPDDDEKKNLNNTKYRIQLIKVTHSIKEIILGMKNEPAQTFKEKEQQNQSSKEVREERTVREKPVRPDKVKFLIPLVILALLIIAGIIAYPKIFKQDELEKLRASGDKISVAVMPFQNLTNDTTNNYLQEGIQEILTTSLSNSGELVVKQTQPIKNLIRSSGVTNYASITPNIASSISKKLDANVFVYGNLIKSGNFIRLNAQLIKSGSEEVFKSFQIDQNPEKIISITDSLSSMIKNFLIISELGKEFSNNFLQNASSNSPEAYRYFSIGMKAFANKDFPRAVEMLSNAFAIDTNFIFAAIHIAFAYGNQGLYEDAKKWILKIYNKRAQMSLFQRTYTNYTYSRQFETPREDIKYLKQILEFDDQIPHTWYDLGWDYSALQQYDNAILAFEKSLELYKKLGIKPWWDSNYRVLGFAYHETNQYKKEKRLYKKAENDFPNNPNIIYRQAVLSLTEGDTKEGNRYIEKYKSIRKESSATEAEIAINLADIYSEANMLDKAEELYREAYHLGANSNRMNTLAYFLIYKDRNVNEGMNLIDKALVLMPDNYNYLHTKGWGLYKQGKYQEALEVLERSWNLRMENARYNHEAWLHLEAAKKAVEEQKNN